MGVGVGDGLGVGVGVDVVPPPQAVSNIARSSEQNIATIPDGVRLKRDVMFFTVYFLSLHETECWVTAEIYLTELMV